MKVVGLMAGTSADGIDAALVELTGAGVGTRVRLLAFETSPYPPGVRERVLEAATRPVPVQTLARLNALLGELFARAALEVVQRAGMPLDEVALIGSHGQTVAHAPAPVEDTGFTLRATLQIGEPAIIAERTGITTVADFRVRDQAAGGHGAPLTPFVHFILFRHPTLHRGVLNLGGIGNLTVIPAGAGLEEVYGFDTGPGNMLIDGAVVHVTGGKQTYDHNGILARQGRVHARLLDWLLGHPFLTLPPPKTTGREEFGAAYLRRVLTQVRRWHVRRADLVATLTTFTARAVADQIGRFVRPRVGLDELIVAGGGAENLVLMASLQQLLPDVKLSPCDDQGLPTRALEAVAFAVLAREAYEGRPNNVPAATGAARPVVMGKIVPGQRPQGRG